jgi:hypothetical protein
MMFDYSTASAMIPGLSGQSEVGNPQLWWAGSAVDQFSNARGLVLAGVRRRALAGGDPRLAYFEFSAPFDNPADIPEEMLLDPDVVSAANPSLGAFISMDWIVGELPILLPRGFAVERLTVGDWPDPDNPVESVIPGEMWDILEADVEFEDPVGFAFDVTPDRSWSAIGAGGVTRDGRFMVEPVHHERGTGWVVPYLLERVRKHKPVVVACDATGAAASLMIELEKEGVEVLAMSAGDHARACGGFYDAVIEGRLAHRGHRNLSAAVRGATQRPLGGAWAWNRKTSAVDISPLVACTLALGAYRVKQAEPPKARPGIVNLANLD